MSTPTCVRVRPKRRIFDTRKSMLLRRSAYNVFGGIRLTVMFPDDRGRPSGCGPLFATASVTVRFADRSLPGSLRHVAASWMSTFGTMYAARPRNEVRNGSTVRQYEFVKPLVVFPRPLCQPVVNAHV